MTAPTPLPPRPNHLRVVDHPAVNLADIPARLRGLAEQIESGKLTPDTAVVVFGELNNEPLVFGFGQASDSFRVIGLLCCAAAVIGECTEPSEYRDPLDPEDEG